MIKFKNTFFGEVKNGELIIENMSDWSAKILKLEGEKVVLSLKKRKKDRSLDQNNYYWGVIISMLATEFGSNEDGIEAEDWWHEFLKAKFLSVIIGRSIKEKSFVFSKVKSTADLSTVEAEEYFAKIRQWASAELSFYIPEPNEDFSLDLINTHDQKNQ